MAEITPIPPGTRFQDLTGKRFGRLTVLGWAGYSKHKEATWVCACDCGGKKVAVGGNLRGGRTQSCGCFSLENLAKSGSADFCARETKKHPEYKVWGQMVSRCHNPKNHAFAHYGERGIFVCDRWRFGENGKHGFACFLEDMGQRPSAEHSIDRLNNDRGYEPANCAWRTRTEQGRNKRNNRMVNYAGRQMPLVEACDIAGISVHTVRVRISNGMSASRALSQPIRQGHYGRKTDAEQPNKIGPS